MKTSDKILRHLSANGRTSHKTLCDELFSGDETKFRESLAYLESKGFVKSRLSDQRTLHTCFSTITDAGLAQPLVEKDEKSASRRQFIREVTIALISAVAGAVVGYFLGS